MLMIRRERPGRPGREFLLALGGCDRPDWTAGRAIMLQRQMDARLIATNLTQSSILAALNASRLFPGVGLQLVSSIHAPFEAFLDREADVLVVPDPAPETVGDDR